MLTMVSYACERHDRCQRHTKSLSQVYLATRGFMDTFLCDQSSGKLVRDKHIPPQPKCQIPHIINYWAFPHIPCTLIHSWAFYHIFMLSPALLYHLPTLMHSWTYPNILKVSPAPLYYPKHPHTLRAIHPHSHAVTCTPIPSPALSVLECV